MRFRVSHQALLWPNPTPAYFIVTRQQQKQGQRSLSRALWGQNKPFEVKGGLLAAVAMAVSGTDGLDWEKRRKRHTHSEYDWAAVAVFDFFCFVLLCPWPCCTYVVVESVVMPPVYLCRVSRVHAPAMEQPLSIEAIKHQHIEPSPARMYAAVRKNQTQPCFNLHHPLHARRPKTRHKGAQPTQILHASPPKAAHDAHRGSHSLRALVSPKRQPLRHFSSLFCPLVCIHTSSE